MKPDTTVEVIIIFVLFGILLLVPTKNDIVEACTIAIEETK